MKTIRIPGSKSVTNRVLFLAAMGGREVVLENLLESDDTVHMRSVLSSFGVEFEERAEGLLVKPPKALVANGDEPLFIGNAGTAARFMAAASLVVHGSYTLKGVDRMHERPQYDLFKALRELGVQIECHGEEGFLPATFTGVKGFPKEWLVEMPDVKLSGNVSSQFVSALLLAASGTENGLVVVMNELPPSQPYIEMTISILRMWGVNVSRCKDSLEDMEIHSGIEAPERYLIAADMSAASYPTAWATLTQTPILIEGWGEETLQGDEGFVDVCLYLGAEVGRAGEHLMMADFGQAGEGKTFDFSPMPDVAMTGMVMAAFYEGEWRFEGLESLRVKECDRIEAMRLGFAQLGVEVQVVGDDVTIKGGDYWMDVEQIKSASIETDSFDDHRIAMCFGVLRSALALRAGVEEESLFAIGEPHCVAKTWPTFWEDMKGWG